MANSIIFSNLKCYFSVMSILKSYLCNDLSFVAMKIFNDMPFGKIEKEQKSVPRW